MKHPALRGRRMHRARIVHAVRIGRAVHTERAGARTRVADGLGRQVGTVSSLRSDGCVGPVASCVTIFPRPSLGYDKSLRRMVFFYLGNIPEFAKQFHA
ncbi:MAG TPA: hypothetical protein PLP74_16045, partial [Quisquiliibacterium sp.]|nr:hypothetical protein [Quisquiliibacterium sp.]